MITFSVLYTDIEGRGQSEDHLQLALTPSTPYVQGFISPQALKNDSLYKEGPHPSTLEATSPSHDTLAQDPGERTEYAVLFSTLLESNALLMDEIRALKEQHSPYHDDNTSVHEHDRLFENPPPAFLKDTWVSESNDEGNTHATRDVVVEDIEPRDLFLSSDPGSPSVGSSSIDPQFASPGALAVQTMWDDFSVEEYSSLDETEAKDSCKKKKEWTPRITVPQPFAMTVRESQTPKQKSRSLRIAEEEKLKKQAEEEAELMRKFRASSVPASTFLPLYELVNAKNEQRREEVKRMSKDLLKSSEKPFSFTKRDRELTERKARETEVIKSTEKKERNSSAFRAKPIPKNLLSSDIKEQIQEQEEYRRIKMQMRSEQLMASSKLPGSMQLRMPRHQKRSQVPQPEYPFQPNINNTVPDYDQAYYDFQQKLAVKKRSKPTTAPEPFFLHTESIPSRKQVIAEDMQRDSQLLTENRWPYTSSRAKVSRKSPQNTRSKTVHSVYPAQMTQTALMRQTLAQEKLACVLQNELNEQEQCSSLKREWGVRKTVAQKSMSTDPTAWLEEKKRQKLKEFK